ncbi:MAG: ArsR family transcriptional regulator [Halobacteriaceae archaeon]
MSRVDSLQDREDALEPADAFSLVGNETRLAILEALWRLEEPARFSEIHDHVGTDTSSRFNYHLGQLTGQFVRQTETGYELRTAGRRVVQAVLAGSFTDDQDRSLAIEDDCVRCGATLEARYSDEMLTIRCPECGHGHGQYSFPPGGLNGRTDAEVLAAFDQRVRHLHCLAKDGVCPACGGRVDTKIEEGEPCCLGVEIRATHVCDQCNREVCSAVGLALLDQSPVVAFYDDHGITLSEKPYWQLPWCVNDDAVTILEEDPTRLQVAITEDDETLTVTLDDDLAIVDTDRTPA